MTRPIPLSPRNPVVEVFFDGACPLCLREIQMLRRKDHKGHIKFVDIADPRLNFAALERSKEQLMAEIHARLPDGTWITGVDVFVALYDAIDFKWVGKLARVKLLRPTFDRLYDIFAANRLRLTGRCSDESSGCDLGATVQTSELSG